MTKNKKKVERRDRAKDHRNYENEAKGHFRQMAKVRQRARRQGPGAESIEQPKRPNRGNKFQDFTITDKLGAQNEPKELSATTSGSGSSAGSSSQESGYIAFDDFDEEGDDVDDALVHQFASFEKELKLDLDLPPYPAPWNKPAVKDTVAEKFTREIRDYTDYVSPKKGEVAERNELVRRIQMLTRATLKNKFECHLFGSSATEMYLPKADVDMVLISQGNGSYREKSVLYSLREAFKRKGWTTDAIVIAHTRVPIIKFTDYATQINVDISIGRMGGVLAVKNIKQWSEKFGALRPLVLVIKQFLKKRNQSEVYQGGLGGYAVICMVSSFLQNHEHVDSDDTKKCTNMGRLLYEFFEYYGHKFNSVSTGLRMTGSMPRVLKSQNRNMQRLGPDTLVIEDPNDHDNNVTRASKNWPLIQREFARAADLIKHMMLEYEKLPPEERSEKSFLAGLLMNDSKVDRNMVSDRLPPQGPSPRPASHNANNTNSTNRPKRGNDLASRFDRMMESNDNERKRNQRNERGNERTHERENKRAKVNELKNYNGEQRPSLGDRLDRISRPSSSENKPVPVRETIDLTEDSPPAPRKRRQEMFHAASSDSEIDVVEVRSIQKNPKNGGSEDEEEASRTKAVSQGAIERRRAFWANKSGVVEQPAE